MAWPSLTVYKTNASSVLNLHGEVLESLAPEGTTLEEAFLPTLKKLHEQFPRLRIIVSKPPRYGHDKTNQDSSNTALLPPLSKPSRPAVPASVV